MNKKQNRVSQFWLVMLSSCFEIHSYFESTLEITLRCSKRCQHLTLWDPHKVSSQCIFPWHALPNWNQIYSITGVIILNYDQHQQQKTISTNNRINSKINQHLTPFVDWCYCGREVLFQKVRLFVVYKLSFDGKQFLTRQIRGIE